MKLGLKINNIFDNDEYVYQVSITDAMVKKFAEATGDVNPIHLDENYAKKTVFKSRIAHGMLLAGLISNVLGTKFPGFGTIYLSQSFNFHKPVYIDDNIKIVVKVTEKKTEKNILRFSTNCINQNDVTVLSGEAVVLAPK